ncbi:MAG: murein hydrolase activator EnvC family protein [Candidatus Cyclobacteriaceae bacterium M2_1C_046]
MSANKIILLFFCFTFAFSGYAQKKSKADLQKEKQEQLKKISETEKILNQTRDKKENSIGQLNALNQRIKVQENLISSIKEEMNLLENEISDKNDIVDALESDLNNLKDEYAKMLYVAQKANHGFNSLTFLFASESFSQLLMRINYLQQYSEARRRQAEQIQKVQVFLTSQMETLQEQKSEKSELLKEQVRESSQLTSLKEKQANLLSALQKQEKEIKKDLESSKKMVAQLEKMIEDLIREEIEKARIAASSGSDLSNSFAENKNKLPWPVSGFVTQKFGRHPHPVLKNIPMESTGINIQTKKDEKVKAIFEGEVRQVSYIPGMGNVIMLKHGNYFTVYAGLKEVYVKTGQKVVTKQEIGSVITKSDGISELRFEVRKNIAALNPEQWLSRN